VVNMPRRKTLLWIFIVCIIICSSIQAEWEDRFSSAQMVTLSEIAARPETWLNVPVRIQLRFAWMSDFFIAYRTHFSPEHFSNFSAWDIQTPIWEKEEFNRVHSYFYMEKNNPELKALFKLRTFDSFCVLAKVESIFANKVFIRVVWLYKLPGNLDVLNLKMIHQAYKLYNKKQYDEALSAFVEIFATNPPDDIKVMFHKNISLIYLNYRKDYIAALQELEKAKLIAPNDWEVNYLIKQCNLMAYKERVQEMDGLPAPTVLSVPEVITIPDIRPAEPIAPEVPVEKKQENLEKSIEHYFEDENYPMDSQGMIIEESTESSIILEGHNK